MSQLNDLTDELILSILSFIVELPFEDSSISKHSNLTHVFPLINKRFHSLCLRSDSLWKIGVERLIKNQPELWGKYLINRMSNETSSSTPAPLIPLNEQNEEDDYRYKYALFNNKSTRGTNLRSSYTQPQIGYHHQIYHDTFQKDIITKQPFLYDCLDQIIPSTGIQIGVEMDVYFDQIEQVTFMTELMKDFLQRNPQFGGVNGGFGGMGGIELVFPNDNDDDHLGDDDDIRPTFIYLNGFKKRKNKKKKNEEEEEDHDHPCAKDQVGQIAYKVKVTQCILYPDDSGHVNFIPVSHVRIKSVSQRDPARTTTSRTTNDNNEDDNEDDISNNNNHNDVILYDARVIGIKRSQVERRRSSASIILDSTVKKGRSIAYRFGLVFKAIFCVMSSLILINIYCVLNLIFTSGETLFGFIWNHGVGSVIPQHAV